MNTDVERLKNMTPRKFALLVALGMHVFMTGCGPSAQETKLLHELDNLKQKTEEQVTSREKELQVTINELTEAKSRIAELEGSLTQARLQIDKFAEEKRLQAEPKEHVVKGDVFIVTKGGESFKLGLVAVSLIHEEALVEYLNNRRNEGSELAAKLGKSLAQQEELLVQRERESQALEAKAKAAFNTALNSPTVDRLWEIQKAAKSAHSAAEDEVYKLSDEISVVKFQIANLKSAEFYFEELPLPFKTAKTNAEGLFSIIMDAEMSASKVWIAASASRSVGKSQEDYFWLLPLRRSSNSASTVVSLNNDNMTNREGEIFMHLQNKREVK